MLPQNRYFVYLVYSIGNVVCDEGTLVLKQLSRFSGLFGLFGLSGLSRLFGDTIHFVNGSEPRFAGLELSALHWK